MPQTTSRSVRTPIPAATQLAGFLSRYSPAIARMGRASRTKLRRLMPAAVELVYDNYNALVFGFGPTDRATDAVVSTALYPRWVTLFFLQGATLDDPDRLLRGSGRQVRSIRLDEAADLDRPAVRALIRAAIRESDVPMPRTGRGRTIVKSVSAQQRPRRPPRKRA